MNKKYFKGLELNDYEKEVFGLKRNRKYKKMNKKLDRNEPKYWDYDSFFFIQLYADLNAFIDSSKCAYSDMNSHTFVDNNGKERTQIDMINYILKLIQDYKKAELNCDLEDEEYLRQIESDILDNFKIILPSLWN